MKNKQRQVLITEFWIRVYSDGRIDYDGFDSLLLWKLRHKPQEGFLPYARKIQGFIGEAKRR
ncbi:MAG: hypothetical protein NTX59_02925 [Elusimicrobia bacterium]|nr:hypothetical protein [Elusimicrobiota bacterium]